MTLAPSIFVELAGEPRGKGRPRFSRKSGVAYTPERTRNYEAALRLAAQAVMANRGEPILTGPLIVRVEAYMPIPKSWSKSKQLDARNGAIRPTTRPDWENLAKCLDALNEVVWKDDSQIVTGLVLKYYSDKPRLTVEVKEVAT